MSFDITSHVNEILKELELREERALEMVGGKVESFAAENVANLTHGEGTLYQHLTHRVDMENKQVLVGSPTEYAPYVELGTGIYYSGGRRTSWCYQDDDGNWHMTKGQRAKPYLKPALEDHKDLYKKMFEGELSGQ